MRVRGWVGLGLLMVSSAMGCSAGDEPDAATPAADAGYGGSLLPSSTSVCVRAALGTNQSVSVTFMNAAVDPVLISDASIVQGARAEVTLVSLEPKTIPASESASALLRFQPIALGWSEATLRIASSDAQRPVLNISVVGLGTDGSSSGDAGPGPENHPCL